ncbi:MAG: hypothetical protein Q9163_001580 [Psora crenata]
MFDALVAFLSAQWTLEWDAAHWYDDSAHDAYRALHPNGTMYWVPAREYTPCSGFASCAEQDAYTARTHHRAMVELVGSGFAFLVGKIKRSEHERECAQNQIGHPTKQQWTPPSVGQPLLAMPTQPNAGRTVYIQTSGSQQTYYLLPRYA